jgi:hypothetical protein
MKRTLAKSTVQPHISTKLHRHLKKQGYTDISLKDIQQSLSGIGVSLSQGALLKQDERRL